MIVFQGIDQNLISYRSLNNKEIVIADMWQLSIERSIYVLLQIGVIDSVRMWQVSLPASSQSL